MAEKFSSVCNNDCGQERKQLLEGRKMSFRMTPILTTVLLSTCLRVTEANWEKVGNILIAYGAKPWEGLDCSFVTQKSKAKSANRCFFLIRNPSDLKDSMVSRQRSRPPLIQKKAERCPLSAIRFFRMPPDLHRKVGATRRKPRCLDD